MKKNYRIILLAPIVFTFLLITGFKSNSDSISSQNEPGIIYAKTLFWSDQDNEVYLKGKNIRVKHGSNKFTVNGEASYLGKVYYLVYNSKEVSLNSSIDVSGLKCQVVKLTKEEAAEKYGSKGELGAVEITVIQQ